jgi:uncharacterized damage-inducible protein DinB
MYRRIEDFLNDWQHENSTTLGVLRSLTDESLDFRAGDGVRTIGRLAWHLVETLSEMPHAAGLHVPEPHVPDAPLPRTVAELTAAYERRAAAVADTVRDRWTDEVLTDVIPMYGQEWSRGTTLSVLIRHEAHHRGQLTVLMRLAGLAAPGCYGPAREEWAQFGMPAMA